MVIGHGLDPDPFFSWADPVTALFDNQGMIGLIFFTFYVILYQFINKKSDFVFVGT